MSTDGSQFVDPALLACIRAQEGKDSLDLRLKHVGDRITFDTQNSIYHMQKLEGRLWLLQGGTRWPKPTQVFIAGSTFGGSMLKTDKIEEGMYVEIHEKATGKVVTTSRVINLWEY